MKIKLKSDWIDFGQLHKAGTVVDVGDDIGATLILEGHTRMPDATPARINPDLYTVGCHPSPQYETNITQGNLIDTKSSKHAKKE